MTTRGIEHNLKIGDIYRHYKGNTYRVVDVAIHSETHEPMVVYRGLYDSKEFGNKPLFVRPLSMFCEKVEIDGKKMERFTHEGA